MVRTRALSDAEAYGYHLNPDKGFLDDLIEGLARNEERFGYPSCPCRLASGKFEIDRDIICPCDYRDPDVMEYGFCYCGLYVKKDVFEGKTSVTQIPERRPLMKQTRAHEAPVDNTLGEGFSSALESSQEASSGTALKMWFCEQCGYVCFREDPPYVCPICKAKQDRFAQLVVTHRKQG
jgi:ferredoxin-thioredoxin reductase catalytic subunit